MVLRQISSLGVKAQAIIAGASYAFWDILLPTIEDAVALTKKPLENKEFFSEQNIWGDGGPRFQYTRSLASFKTQT